MNAAILLLIAATGMRPGGDMRDVSMHVPRVVTGGGTPAPTVTIDAMPFARTVTCTGDYTLTGTATDVTSVAWAASPSGASGACTGTTSWSCVVAVAPDATGEGVETVTVTATGAGGTGDDAETIGFYVDGAHSCFLAQNIDGTYNSSLSDGAVVTTWENLGSSGLDVTQSSAASKPTLREIISTGQPTVQFDGNDRILATLASDWSFMTDGTDVTVEITYASLSDAANVDLIATRSSGGSSTGMWIRQQTDEAISVLVSSPTVILSPTSATTTAALNKYQTITTVLDDNGGAGTDMTIYYNGASVATGSVTGAYPAGPPSAPLTIGSAGVGAVFYLNGHITSILIYQSALTATQRAINKAVDEWALGGTLPLTIDTSVIPGRYLFVGDSLTSDDRADSWPSVLWADHAPVDGTYVNAAVSGATSAAILRQWNLQVPNIPEKVFVLGGTNSISAGGTAVATFANLSPIYSEAQSYGSEVIAMSIYPFGTNGSWTAARQVQLEALNVSVLGSIADVTVDLYVTTGDPGTPTQLLPAYDAGDGVHLNATGNIIVSGVVSTAAGL